MRPFESFSTKRSDPCGRRCGLLDADLHEHPRQFVEQLAREVPERSDRDRQPVAGDGVRVGRPDRGLRGRGAAREQARDRPASTSPLPEVARPPVPVPIVQVSPSGLATTPKHDTTAS